jgi:hypothetical protein
VFREVCVKKESGGWWKLSTIGAMRGQEFGRRGEGMELVNFSMLFSILSDVSCSESAGLCTCLAVDQSVSMTR